MTEWKKRGKRKPNPGTVPFSFFLRTGLPRIEARLRRSYIKALVRLYPEASAAELANIAKISLPTMLRYLEEYECLF